MPLNCPSRNVFQIPPRCSTGVAEKETSKVKNKVAAKVIFARLFLPIAIAGPSSVQYVVSIAHSERDATNILLVSVVIQQGLIGAVMRSPRQRARKLQAWPTALIPSPFQSRFGARLIRPARHFQIFHEWLPFRQKKAPHPRGLPIHDLRFAVDQVRINALAAHTAMHGTSHQAMLILDRSRLRAPFRLSLPCPRNSFALGTTKTWS